MPDKLVLVKILEKPLDRNNKPYFKITDQDNAVFNLFHFVGSIEVNKSYLLTYEMNANGYPDVSKVTPLTNLFQQKALKEIANRNDIWRNFSVSFSYAKDLVVGNQIKLDDIFTYADKIYDYLQEKTNEIFGGEKSDV